MQTPYTQFILPIMLLLALPACASSTSLDKVLAGKQAPAGVVIEIVTGDQQGLDWALPQAQEYIKRLRRRFPALPITIVTHGREQFALQKAKRDQGKKIHSLTQSLRKDDVQLHVCGTYAERKGLSKEDFPEYVDVAPAGPAQVNNYMALDYVRIIIKRRAAQQ